jgi:3-deoxy-manno-octulosonate cytidylyltransferase (CMP-KDO synthetase)
MSDVLVVIPARLQASRLPGKPLEKIGGEAMIVQVWRRAVEADLGPVLVATDSLDIADAVEAAGGRALLTRSDHVSGSDRVYEAVSKIDPEGAYQLVINLQGDLPTLQPELLAACVAPLRQGDADIATLAAEIQDEAERDDPHVVKVIATPASGSRALRALYFTRATAPAGEGPLYHHIGLYAFRREALKRFVALPPSPLERREKLEQLRALEDGMRIDVALVDTVPLGVDTPADLERARALMAQQG